MFDFYSSLISVMHVHHTVGKTRANPGSHVTLFPIYETDEKMISFCYDWINGDVHLNAYRQSQDTKYNLVNYYSFSSLNKTSKWRVPVSHSTVGRDLALLVHKSVLFHTDWIIWCKSQSARTVSRKNAFETQMLLLTCVCARKISRKKSIWEKIFYMCATLIAWFHFFHTGVWMCFAPYSLRQLQQKCECEFLNFWFVEKDLCACNEEFEKV